MSYQTEFPGFPASDMPTIPASFIDTSWHNDVCPSFTSDALGLTIFIDFANPADRECDGAPRFTVSPQDHGVECSGPSLSTDDWLQVLAFVIERAKEAIATESLGACDQAKLDMLNDTIERLFEQQAADDPETTGEFDAIDYAQGGDGKVY